MKVHFLAVVSLLGAPAASATTPLDFVKSVSDKVKGNLRGLQANITDSYNVDTAADGNSTIANSTASDDDFNATAIAAADAKAKDDQEGDPQSACCEGKGQKDGLTLIFRFMGGGCDQKNPPNSQMKGYECTGTANVGDSVTLEKADFVGGNPGMLEIGETFEISPNSNDIKIMIGRQVLDDIHTSCSDFLYLGDFFGSLVLVGYTPTSDNCPGGPIPPTQCVNDMVGGNQDTGCNPFEPLCEEKDPEENECRVCVNDKPDGLQDSGCTEGCKICVGLKSRMTRTLQGKKGEPSQAATTSPTIGSPFTTTTPEMLESELDHGEFGDVCKVCQDDKGFAGLDSGCSETLPICVIEHETSKHRQLAAGPGLPTNLFGDTCAKCIDDSNTLDSGCNVENPVCVTSGESPFGYTCVPCINNNGSADVDDGCSSNAPFCNGPFIQPNSDITGAGTGCFKCRNDSDDNTDSGCDDGYPNCVAASDDYGSECAVCINNVQNEDVPIGEPVPVDLGCSEDKPVCNGHYHEKGTVCAVCVNDQVAGDCADSGCTGDKPICVASNGEPDFGKPGLGCFSCFNNNDNDTPDLGCNDPGLPFCDANFNEGGDECVLCVDNEDGDTPDLGCTNLNLPLCDSTEGVCRKCINDELAGGQDTGCSMDFPICYRIGTGFEAPFGGFGNDCGLCINDETTVGDQDTGCPSETPECQAADNGVGTECSCPFVGGSGSCCTNAECLNDATPFCVDNTCAECEKEDDCPVGSICLPDGSCDQCQVGIDGVQCCGNDDCPAAGSICLGDGTCSGCIAMPGTVDCCDNDDCLAGSLCLDGTCQGCVAGANGAECCSNGQCPAGSICNPDKTCSDCSIANGVECCSNDDCPAGSICGSGGVCSDCVVGVTDAECCMDSDCPTGSICNPDKTCSDCQVDLNGGAQCCDNDDCPTGSLCDDADKMCSGCSIGINGAECCTTGHCPMGSVCIPDSFTCSDCHPGQNGAACCTNDDCLPGSICGSDKMCTTQCVPGITNAECCMDSDCPTGSTCRPDKTCSDCQIDLGAGVECCGNNDCPPGSLCDADKQCSDCMPGFNGADCCMDSDCPTGSICNPDKTCSGCQTGADVECCDNSDCSFLTDQCNTGVCQADKTCFQVVAPDGTGCNDGDKCTSVDGTEGGADECVGGMCLGNQVICSETFTCNPATGTCECPGECCDDSDCDDLSDECNTGECQADNTCLKVPKLDGTSCDDGLACTSADGTELLGDECMDGVCLGTPVVCDPDTNTCDPVDGSCGTCVESGDDCMVNVDTCCGAGACIGGKCAESCLGDANEPGFCTGNCADCALPCDAKCGCTANDQMVSDTVDSSSCSGLGSSTCPSGGGIGTRPCCGCNLDCVMDNVCV